MRDCTITLVFCLFFVHHVFVAQAKCVVLVGSDACTGEGFSYSVAKTVTYSSGTHSESTQESSESSSHVYRRESTPEGDPVEAYLYYNTTSEASHSTSHTIATNLTKIEKNVTFESTSVEEANGEAPLEAEGSEESILLEESVTAVEGWTIVDSGTWPFSERIDPRPAVDPVPRPPMQSLAVESTPEPSPTVLSEPETPTPVVESPSKPEMPLAYYPCGYPKPAVPESRDVSQQMSYHAVPDAAPCPLTPLPTSPSVPDHSPTPPPPPPRPNVTLTPSEVLAKKVKEIINTGNFTALSELVIESDDIYGLNMGLRFTDDERETELTKTAERETDKDVIVLKALALAALNPGTTDKVVQLMVVTATAPNAYSFDSHRTLTKQFEVVFSQPTLLRTIVASNAQEYLRRRLLCAGCIPTNSYICAHCWPSAVCSTYFWCPSSAAPSEVAPAESIEEEAKRKEEKNRDALNSDVAQADASDTAIEEPSREATPTVEAPKISKSQKRRARRRRRRQEKRENKKNGSQTSTPPNKAPSRDP